MSVDDGGATEAAWQKLWVSLLTHPWKALAVLAPDNGGDAERLAQILAGLGTRGDTHVEVVSARGAQLSNVQQIVARVSDASGSGALVLVPCDPVPHHPAMVPILHAVTGVVLVVRLGESFSKSVKQTVDVVGRERVFASVAIG